MTITTILILNGVLALGLLAGLAVVMLTGHRVAAPEHEPLQLDYSRRVESELERAA